MNGLLLALSFLAVVLSIVPGGDAGLAYAHRYHKRHASALQRKDNTITPRYIGNVKRNSCRVRPSSLSVVSSSAVATQSVVSSSFSSAIVITSSQATVLSSVSSLAVDTPTTSAVPATTEEPTTAAIPSATSAASQPSTTPAQVTTSNSASSPQDQTSASSDSSQSVIDQYLDDQNSVRAQHGASPLTWNNTLAAAAQQWANGCVFQHSGGTLGPYGENLAAGTGSSYGISAAISSWTSEVSEYDPSNPQASHFTQVVWKATTEVGCAVQECSGIFPASYGEAQYYVCEYFPQGNVIGEFTQNVQV